MVPKFQASSGGVTISQVKQRRFKTLSRQEVQARADMQAEEDKKIFDAMSGIIEDRIAEMKRQGWIHVWDEVEVE